MTATINASTTAGVVTTADTSGILQLQTNGTAALTVDASQNVGIGTASPSSKLEVYDATSAVARVTAGTEIFEIRNTGSEVRLAVVSADPMTFRTSNVEAMRIDSSGNVGIGTSSPAAFGSDTVLAIYNASTPRIKLQNSTTGSANTDGGELNMSGSDFIVENRENGNIRLFNNGAERARITSDGYFGVNCTPSSAWFQSTMSSGSASIAGRFQHPGNATFGTVLSIETTGGTDNPSVSWKNNNGGSPTYYSINLSSSGTLHFNTNGNESGFGTQRFSFDNAGNAYKGSGAGSWLALSDERIKTNIEDVVGGLSRIAQLRPRKFDYKQPEAHNGKVHEKGFIAQELAEVYPDSVTETDFILEQDKQYFADGEKAKAIGFNSEFYADLVCAIQELKAIVDAQGAEIAALKGATA